MRNNSSTRWKKIRCSVSPYRYVHVLQEHEPGGNSFDSPIGAGGTSYLLDRHVDATVLNAYFTLNPTTVIYGRDMASTGSRT